MRCFAVTWWVAYPGEIFSDQGFDRGFRAFALLGFLACPRARAEQEDGRPARRYPKHFGADDHPRPALQGRCRRRCARPAFRGSLHLATARQRQGDGANWRLTEFRDEATATSFAYQATSLQHGHRTHLWRAGDRHHLTTRTIRPRLAIDDHV